MISVTEIAFTGYPVTDIARARAFYEGLLNLKPTVDFQHDGKHWIEYDIGPATLAISDVNPACKPTSDGPSVALEVADFDAAIAAAHTAGAKFTLEPMTFPSCQLAVILDPDGNSLTLHKRTQQ